MLQIKHIDEFYEIVKQYQKQTEVIDYFNDPKHNAQMSGATYRTINHWCEVGLLDDNRGAKKGWRKFGLIDLIRIKIYSTLRDYGYSLEKLQTVKESLQLLDGKAAPLIEVALSGCLQFDMQIFLVVDVHGDATIMFEQDIPVTELQYGYQDYLRIDFNQLLSDLFYSENFLATLLSPPIQVVGKERLVLEALRKGDCDTISVKMKDGQIVTLEKTSSSNEKTALRDVMAGVDFGEVTIKKVAGEVTHITAREKEKL